MRFEVILSMVVPISNSKFQTFLKYLLDSEYGVYCISKMAPETIDNSICFNEPPVIKENVEERMKQRIIYVSKIARHTGLPIKRMKMYPVCHGMNSSARNTEKYMTRYMRS